MDAARGAPDWPAIAEFLARLYSEKFRDLCDETVATALEKAAAKRKVLDKGVAALDAAGASFESELPGLKEHAQACIGRIEAYQRT